MCLLFSFFVGGYLILVHHNAVHTKHGWKITSLLTCGWYLKPFHEIHHKYFLEGKDDFSWARRNESFYRFFMRSHFKRRVMAGLGYMLLDLITFVALSYLLGPLYIVCVLGFTFHWEMFEYWSHYGLKDITTDKYRWSWNVLGKSYNKFLLGLGRHSRHHVVGQGHVPLVYGLKFYQFYMSYLPLLPNNYFKFMEKQVIINKQRGIL